jgi:hypothetical protein
MSTMKPLASIILLVFFVVCTLKLYFISKSLSAKTIDTRTFYVYSVPEDLLYKGYNIRPETCPLEMYSAEIVVPEYIKRHTMRYESNPEKASFFVVPQFSSCYYHFCLNEQNSTIEGCKEQTRDYFEEILNWVEDTHPFWERNSGRDHVFIFSWDQGSEILGYNTIAANRAASSIHLVHHGKRDHNDQNYMAMKDVVIPVYRNYYMADRLSTKKVPKKIFAYFRGTIKDDPDYGLGIRKYIRHLGQVKPDKYYVKDGHSEYYWNELAHSNFSLCPPGWSLWSPRFYDAIQSKSIPVLFGGLWILPFEGSIDYSKFVVTIKPDQIKSTDRILHELDENNINSMLIEMSKVNKHFRYSEHIEIDGPIDLMVKEILTKHPGKRPSPQNVIRGIDEEASENY